MGGENQEEWVAKLIARLRAAAALWVRIQISLKKQKRHKQRSGKKFTLSTLDHWALMSDLEDILFAAVFSSLFDHRLQLYWRPFIVGIKEMPETNLWLNTAQASVRGTGDNTGMFYNDCDHFIDKNQ